MCATNGCKFTTTMHNHPTSLLCRHVLFASSTFITQQWRSLRKSDLHVGIRWQQPHHMMPHKMWKWKLPLPSLWNNQMMSCTSKTASMTRTPQRTEELWLPSSWLTQGTTVCSKARQEDACCPGELSKQGSKAPPWRVIAYLFGITKWRIDVKDLWWQRDSFSL